MDDTFVQARIDWHKTQIVALETAYTALAGGAESFTIDTGHTTRTVKKTSLVDLGKEIKALAEQLTYWEGQLSTASNGTIVAIPAY